MSEQSDDGTGEEKRSLLLKRKHVDSCGVSIHYLIRISDQHVKSHTSFFFFPLVTSTIIMFNSEDIKSTFGLKSQATDYETANYPPEHDCNTRTLSPSVHPL